MRTVRARNSLAFMVLPLLEQSGSPQAPVADDIEPGQRSTARSRCRRGRRNYAARRVGPDLRSTRVAVSRSSVHHDCDSYHCQGTITVIAVTAAQTVVDLTGGRFRRGRRVQSGRVGHPVRPAGADNPLLPIRRRAAQARPAVSYTHLTLPTKRIV